MASALTMASSPADQGGRYGRQRRQARQWSETELANIHEG
jgi:hypothetical protein